MPPKDDSYEARLAALASQAVDSVSAVLYGGADSLAKRQQIKERLEQSHTSVDIQILDEVPFTGGVFAGELALARRAVANVFLISPHRKSYGPLHELTTIIERRSLSSVAVLYPEEGEWGDDYTSSVGREAMQAIPWLCYTYPASTWAECSEITHILDRELRVRLQQHQLFPDRFE